MDNEFILLDRIQKIRQIIGKYGEQNFYLSFSGGKDSCVLSYLIDMAIPNNKIPRVFSDTGIEYEKIKNFVYEQKEKKHSWDLIIIKPVTPIKPMLNKIGYPFKSKEHSAVVNYYQRTKNTNSKWIQRYINRGDRFACPEKLLYQFTSECNLKISDKCCDKLKKEPLHKWQKDNNKPYAIVGVMRSEGGRRSQAQCLAFRNGKFINFQPLAPINKDWEDWFISKYNIEICDIYKPPYNFTRTGCKGCPFAKNLKYELTQMEKFFPNERKQCEILWQPVYDEYRRIHFRLKE